jgi:uncharacterized membrane protein
VRISEIKRQARGMLKGNWGLAVSLTLIIFVINSVPTTAVNILFSGGIQNMANETEMPIGASLFQLIFSIALIPLSVAVYWFYLNLVRGNKLDIADVFTIYKDSDTTFKVIGLYILQGIFIFLWSLLFIIPGIIKSLSYSQTFYLLRDHPEYSITQAITESRIRMNGYKGKYFLLNLSFIGWGILCAFSLGIGLLWLIPYMSASTAEFYNELIASQDYKEEIF